MRVESAVKELWANGYSLTISGEDIRFKHWGLLQPSPERFAFLVSEIKKDKPKAIEYIKQILTEIENQPIIKWRK